jgi:hypothetical protein
MACTRTWPWRCRRSGFRDRGFCFFSLHCAPNRDSDPFWSCARTIDEASVRLIVARTAACFSLSWNPDAWPHHSTKSTAEIDSSCKRKRQTAALCSSLDFNSLLFHPGEWNSTLTRTELASYLQSARQRGYGPTTAEPHC